MNHRYLKNVTTLGFSPEKCSGCGRCAQVCPHRVFSIEEKKAWVTRQDRCMECGACAMNCPASAITVSSGVGCAAAVIMGWLRGTDASCDCVNEDGCC